MIIGAWDAIKTTVSSVLEAINSVITSVMNTIMSFITSVLNTISSVFTSVFNAILSVVTSVFNSIKSVAETIWNGICSVITNVVNTVKNTVSSVFNAVAGVVGNVFNGIKNTAVSIWNGIKNAIITPIEAAKNKVKAVVDAITGFFAGIRLSLPHIKLPHFSIKGHFSLAPPSVPYLAIDWYKKAMDKPMLLNGATIFGEKNGHLLGGGEKGPEVIMGLDALQNMSAGANTQMLSVMNQILTIMDAYFPQFSNQSIVLDTGELVGGIASRMDSELFKLQTRKTRGW